MEAMLRRHCHWAVGIWLIWLCALLHCSVDGLHSSDLTAYLALEPSSTMATLAKGGVVYPNAYLPGPSDSFPGILALTTGNNATVTGVYYGKQLAQALKSLVKPCM